MANGGSDGSAVTNGGSEQMAGATGAVAQRSVVVRARLVQTESCRRWCGSIRQGTAMAAVGARMRRATAQVETEVQAGALTAALVAALAGRGKKKV